MNKLPNSMTIGQAKKLGRMGDTELVHLNKHEVNALSALSPDGRMTINPKTGQPEAFLPFLMAMLPSLFPGMGAALAGATGLSALANPLTLAALGSGIGTTAETGDLKKGIMAGLGSYALGGLGDKLGGLGKAAADAGQSGALTANMATSADPLAAVRPDMTVALPKEVFSPQKLSMMGQIGSGLGAAWGAGPPKQAKTDDQDYKPKNYVPVPKSYIPTQQGYRPGLDGEHRYFSPADSVGQIKEAPGPNPLPNGDDPFAHLPDWMRQLGLGGSEQGYAKGGLVDSLFSGGSSFGLLNPTAALGGIIPWLLNYNEPGTPESRAAEEAKQNAMGKPQPIAGLQPMIPGGYAMGGPVMPPQMMPQGQGMQRPMMTMANQQPMMSGPMGGGMRPPVGPPMNPMMGGGGQPPQMFPGSMGPQMMGSQQVPMQGYKVGGSISVPRGPMIHPYLPAKEMIPYHDPKPTLPYKQFRPGSRGHFATGGEVMGPGDGQSDSVPAIVDGKAPSALSSGEFVVPSDAVSHLGNGSNAAGAKRLHQMVHHVRMKKTGHPGMPPRV